MNRRTALRSIVSAGLAISPGCTALSSDGDSSGSTRTAFDRPNREAAESQVQHGFPSTICETSIIEDFTISAITDPAFGTDWTSYDIPPGYRSWDASGLAEETVVIGLSRGTRARAYPISVLWVHEIVNEQFDGPVMLTYCSLCRSGMVAERTVHGRETIFGVSGQLWRPSELQARAAASDGRAFAATRVAANATSGNESSATLVDQSDIRVTGNLVMYDDLTRSFWSQLLARAICGPKTGTDLRLLPSTLTTWDRWREEHPETKVLLPPPHSTVM